MGGRAVGLVAAAGVAVGVAAVGLGGVWPSSGDTIPACSQLPTAARASEALRMHQALTEELEALGGGISVEVGTPCGAGQDRALVSVSYASDGERDEIRRLLERRDGFGVPVRLVAP